VKTEMTNPVGRPRDPNGIVKTGEDVHTWLNKKDIQKLRIIAKLLEVSMAQAIRLLIRSYALDRQGDFLIVKKSKK
jgi:hypothetical protein